VIEAVEEELVPTTEDYVEDYDYSTTEGVEDITTEVPTDAAVPDGGKVKVQVQV
jgi:hypothetical protein